MGTFKNDRDAALARDKRIREMFGEVEELLNFPLSKTPDCNATTPPNDGSNGIAPLLQNNFISTHQNDVNSATNPPSANAEAGQTTGESEVNGSAANVIANVINGEELSVNNLKTKHEDQKEDLFKEPPTPATTPAQNLQLGLPELKPRFSNLTRYGSSSSASLNFPYINFNGQLNASNTHDTDTKGDNPKNSTQYDLTQSGAQQSSTQNQLIDFPNSNLAIANTFKYNQMNSMQNSYGFPEPCQATPQQLIPGNYNSYNNYNNFVNLNLQDFSIQRPRAVLAKRFSSSDSCGTSLSFPLQTDPVLTPTAPGVQRVQHQYSHMRNVSLNPLGETTTYAHTNSTSSNTESETSKSKNLEQNAKRAKTATAQ